MSSLGARYLLGEQVIAGPVQTFRARVGTTGRPVFVHRVADTSLPEQAALLKLLLSCLYRSAAVKEQVLDVREEGEVCFVVTESVPQCMLLREWLQFEAARSDSGLSQRPNFESLKEQRPPASPDISQHAPLPTPFSGSKRTVAVPSAVAPHPVIPDVQRPSGIPAPSQPGEFTRMFEAAGLSLPRKSSDPIALRESPVVDAPQRPLPTVHPPPVNADKPKDAGEFTRLFNTSLNQGNQPSPQPAPIRSVTPVLPEPPSTPLSSEHVVVDLLDASESAQNASRQKDSAPGDSRQNASEFSQLFPRVTQAENRSDSAPSGALEIKPTETEAQGLPHRETSPRDRQSTGEFTRFFGSGGQPVPPPTEKTAAPALRSPEMPASAASDGFTQLFAVPSALKQKDMRDIQTPEPDQPVPDRQFKDKSPFGTPAGGEFTRMFGGQGGAVSPQGQPAPAAGEYTQMFGGGNKSSQSKVDQPIFTLSETNAKIADAPKPPPAGPGEFTRVVTGQPQAVPASPQATNPAPVSQPSPALPSGSIAASIPRPSLPTVPKPTVQGVQAPSVSVARNGSSKRPLLVILLLAGIVIILLMWLLVFKQ